MEKIMNERLAGRNCRFDYRRDDAAEITYVTIWDRDGVNVSDLFAGKAGYDINDKKEIVVKDDSVKSNANSRAVWAIVYDYYYYGCDWNSHDSIAQADDIAHRRRTAKAEPKAEPKAENGAEQTKQERSEIVAKRGHKAIASNVAREYKAKGIDIIGQPAHLELKQWVFDKKSREISYSINFGFIDFDFNVDYEAADGYVSLPVLKVRAESEKALQIELEGEEVNTEKRVRRSIWIPKSQARDLEIGATTPEILRK